MIRKLFNDGITQLIKIANEDGRENELKLLRIALVLQIYPPEVQAAVAKECDAVVTKWATRLRDAMNAQDEVEEREWFRDHVWPEDLT